MDILQMVVEWRCLARNLANSSAASSRTRTSVYARDHTRPPNCRGRELLSNIEIHVGMSSGMAVDRLAIRR